MRMLSGGLSKMSDSECPTCGKTLKSKKGVNLHHAMSHGESLTKVDTECDNCGKEISIHRGRYERSEHNFCGHSCMGEYKAETMEGENNPSYNSAIIECDYCGDDIEREKSRIGYNDHNFCNSECKSNWQSEYRRKHQPQKNRITVECANCGGKIKRTPTRVRNNEMQFCDMDCQSEWRTDRTGSDAPQFKENLVECTYCGKEFHKQPSKASKSEHHFCSVKCGNEWRSEYFTGSNHPRYIEGEFHYGKGWNESKRQSVRERDGYECVYCGMGNRKHKEKKGSRLHVHHIKPARLFDDDEKRNSMSNLETVCNSCHRKVESLYPLRPA